MFVSQERLTVWLLLGVTGAVVGIHLLIASFGPGYFAQPFSAAAHEGDQVSLQGTVGSVTWTSAGGHLLFTVNGTTVFVPSETAAGLRVQQGEVVEIVGIVQIYQGKKEVMVEDPSGIRVLASSAGQGPY